MINSVEAFSDLKDFVFSPNANIQCVLFLLFQMPRDYIVKHNDEGEEYYRCKWCEQESDQELTMQKQKRAMQQHVRRKHSSRPKAEDCQCTECFVSLPTFSALKLHQQKKHPEKTYYYCESCDYFCHTDSALSSHVFREHPSQKSKEIECMDCWKTFETDNALFIHRHREHPRPQRPEPPSPQYTKATVSSIVKDPLHDSVESRLGKWNEVFRGMEKLPFSEWINPLKDAKVLRGFVNQYWDSELVYQFVCHPDSKTFGELIDFIFPFACVCPCNVLRYRDPELVDMVPDGEKHMHYLVRINRVLLDPRLKSYYMLHYTDALKTSFKPLNSKLHMLNVALYLMGKQSSRGVDCHNAGSTGLTLDEKDSIREEVMYLDETFRYSKKELQQQKRYMAAGCDTCDMEESDITDIPEDKRKNTPWDEKLQKAKQDSPIGEPYFWDV